MHHFDYSFLDNGMLPAGLINITADIYSLRGLASDRKDTFKDVFKELVQATSHMQEEMSETIEPVETEEPEMSM